VEVTWKTGYSKEQCVTVGMYKNQPKEDVQIIKVKDLVPEYLKQQDEETHVYTFVAVQRLGANLGYVVMVDAEKLYKRGQLASVMSAFHNAYTNLRNLENLRKINKRLDSVYIKDALTDMYNRFGYMRDGYAMHEKSKLYGKPLMVMFMDMDHLKEINDIHGHSAGDNALIMYSSVLKKCEKYQKERH
jgi:predicted signal transduction protein with EAL and GGDEF domain